jgi:hypothetical protein
MEEPWKTKDWEILFEEAKSLIYHPDCPKKVKEKVEEVFDLKSVSGKELYNYIQDNYWLIQRKVLKAENSFFLNLTIDRKYVEICRDFLNLFDILEEINESRNSGAES